MPGPLDPFFRGLRGLRAGRVAPSLPPVAQQWPSFPPVAPAQASPGTLREAAAGNWVRRIADTVNTLLSGKMNVVVPVLLLPGAGATPIIDARISPFSALLFSPRTPAAAAEMTTLFVVAQTNGRAVVAHSVSSDIRLFHMAILG